MKSGDHRDGKTNLPKCQCRACRHALDSVRVKTHLSWFFVDLRMALSKRVTLLYELKSWQTNANVTWTEIDLLLREISETQTLCLALKQKSERGRISGDI